MNKIGSKSCNFTTEIQDYDANIKSKGTLSKRHFCQPNPTFPIRDM